MTPLEVYLLGVAAMTGFMIGQLTRNPTIFIIHNTFVIIGGSLLLVAGSWASVLVVIEERVRKGL